MYKRLQTIILRANDENSLTEFSENILELNFRGFEQWTANRKFFCYENDKN